MMYSTEIQNVESRLTQTSCLLLFIREYRIASSSLGIPTPESNTSKPIGSHKNIKYLSE